MSSQMPAVSLAVAVSLRLCGLSAGELPRAVNLRTDGRPSPARVFHPGDPAPKLSWTFQGAAGKTQQGYQVEVLEGSLGGTPALPLTVYAGYDPAVLKEQDVWREDVTDSRLQRKVWTERNGQANEVPFHLGRAPGRSHTYAWRIRLHDGQQWGPWSDWQSFTPNQVPYAPRALNVRDPQQGEAPGEIVAAEPRPQGQSVQVKAGKDLAAAVARMKPGDICLIGVGAFAGDLRIEAPFVTLKAAVGAEGKAVVEGKVSLRGAGGIVLDGLVVKGSLEIYAPKCVVRNCSVFGSTRASGEDGCFWSCRFEVERGEAFEACWGGNAVEVIRCRVKATGAGLCAGRPVVGCVFTENVVRGGETGGLRSYDAQNLRWSYNIVHGCTRGIQIYRTAHDELHNNLFHNCTTAIFGSSGGTNVLIRNNIVADSGGLLASFPGDRFDYDYNAFFNIRGNRAPCNYWGERKPDPAWERVAYRDGGHNISADPAFVSPAKHDFRPRERTPLADAGDPSFPVPVGGGERVDIGPYEHGASFPCTDWQPKFRVTSPSPAITWKFEDWDKEDTQAAFQVQVDASCYFDSEGLVDSGKLKGNAGSWRVPRPLKLGKYHFRVRLADDKQPELFGLWSDRHYCFEVSTAR